MKKGASCLKPIVLAAFWLVAGLWGQQVCATHQKAAELIIEHVSGYTYKAKLYTYTFTQSPADRPALDLFWGDGTSSTLVRERIEYIGNQTQLNYYESSHTYGGPGIYVLYMEDANRNAGVLNVPNSIVVPMFISSTLVISPWLGAGDNGPVTTVSPIADNACLGQPYVHNPGAYDPDGDVLTYRLVQCRGAGGEPIAGYTFPSASDTFYMDARGGNLVWENPIMQGEYNVAILIEQWRNQAKIGDLTRDMQIIVRACDNKAPAIEVQNEYCVTAGDTLFIPITAYDPDGDRITVGFSGELSTFDPSRTRMVRMAQNGDTVHYGFYWYIGLEQSRLNEYQLFIRAEDDGDPHLSTTKTVSVRVNAPATEFTSAEAFRKEIRLTWKRTSSPHAVYYRLYRRGYESDMELPQDECMTGLADSSYFLVTSDLLAKDTSFTDIYVEEGRRYCYRIFAVFADDDESYISEPVCVSTRNFAPLITRASVENTDWKAGLNRVCWQAPKEIDSSRIGRWVYRLYGGTHTGDMALVAELPYDTAVCYTDSLRNTADKRYMYRVALDSFASSAASTVYLTAVGLSGRIYLEWGYEQPWRQNSFTVYRASAEDYAAGGAGVPPAPPGPEGTAPSPFKAIATLSRKEAHYTDYTAEPEKEYVYYVEAEGSYEPAVCPQALYNKSNLCAATALLPDPCKPYLFLVSSTCLNPPPYNALRNILTWDYDSSYRRGSSLSTGVTKETPSPDECERVVAYYEVYRKYAENEEYEWIGNTKERRFVDEKPGSLYCIYQVRAIAVSGGGQVEIEGPFSNALAVDGWPCFSYSLPNVFTPNGKGPNEVWRAREPQFIEKFEITVVNRWGVEVYRSKDYRFEWDGTVGGKGNNPCPDGPYFYHAVIQVRLNGQLHRIDQSGSVSILR